MTVFWMISALVVALDRVAKYLTQQSMILGERIDVIGGVLELRYTHNTGMALGFLSGYTVFGIVLPLLAVVIGVWVLRKFNLTNFVRVGLGLIFGGFIANFADRLLLGYVVDMIYFPWLPFFICNIADIAITFGTVLMGFSLLFRPRDWHEKKTGGADSAENSNG